MKNKEKIICWWSGGITSAVACKKAIDIYGKDSCRIVMIDTFNEDEDTYRFKKDCEKWYKLDIESITAIGDKYKDIEDVWLTHKSLNTATGAICSSNLKRLVRERWEKENGGFTHQVFGFEFDKKDCIKIVEEEGIEVPKMYKLGFQNNNCFKTGCVQGGIGYWKKMKEDFPDKFFKMAEVEHKLTNLKGEPVTMLKDQSKEAKRKTEINKKANLVFLLPHPDYPEHKCIDDMKGRPVEPLFDCNGMCGVNDLTKRSKTETEINYS